MFAAYSYFRAEGVSLSTVETVAEAEAELLAMEKALAKRFGASELHGYVQHDTGRYTISSFRFDAPKKKPEGWVTSSAYGNSTYAMPKDGSAEHFHILDMAGLMERAAKRTKLEDMLKSGDMPWRDMLDGQSISRQFVRYAAAEGDNTKPSGQLSDAFASAVKVMGGPWKAADPLSYAKMDGAWYIRVPNIKGTERPAYTPPDAVPVPYDDMLSADRREQQLRYDKLRGSTFEGYA